MEASVLLGGISAFRQCVHRLSHCDSVYAYDVKQSTRRNHMSIKITFEGLCAFFTRNLLQQSSLLIGLVEVSDSTLPLTEFHIPKIQIKEEGSEEVLVEYTGISGKNRLTGDVFLHLISENEVVAPNLSSVLGLNDNPTLLDIEKDLYPQEDLNINPRKSRALLHVNNGVLSPNLSRILANSPPVFEALEYRQLNPDGTFTVLPITIGRKLLYSAQIAVEIPKKGYAILHFAEGADDFVFKGDRNYEVAVTSLSQASLNPETIEINHFQYFYRLANNVPSKIIVPELQPGGENGTPPCMHGGFGDTP